MIEVGGVYTAYRQGTAITPIEISVRVVWIDGENVHYQKEGSCTVDQTTLKRLEEIINPKFSGRG